MSNDKIKLALDKLNNALTSLETSLVITPDPDRIVIDASIRRFGFSVELSSKALKRVLAFEGIDANTPKDTFRKAFMHGLIDDEQTWITMLNERNNTSHTYDKKRADGIYGHLPKYASIMRDCYFRTLSKYLN